MARVRISWDGGEAVEYEGGQEWIRFMSSVVNYTVKAGLALVSKGAGDLQYETGQGVRLIEMSGHDLYDYQEGQLDLEDAIKEVKDNGC